MYKHILVVLSLICLSSQSIYSMSSSSSNSDSQEASTSDSRTFYTYAIEELQNSYNRASGELKALVRKLQNSIYLKKPQTRIVFFIGKPGTDKTTSALMVAYKLQDKFDYEFINCPDLTGSNRGEGTVALRNKIESSFAKEYKEDKGIILILDEIQELLDHADDPHYDTASMGRYLTAFLNEIRMNDKVFIIAICNDCGTFPDQIRSRMVGHIIEFKDITDTAAKMDAFLGQLKIQGVTLHSSCSREILIKKIRPIKEWSGRDFESLVNILINQFFEKDNTEGAETIKIDSDNIDRAIQTVHRDKKIAAKSKDAETDQQQRERHHKDDQLNRDIESIRERFFRSNSSFGFIIRTIVNNYRIKNIRDLLNGGYLDSNQKDYFSIVLKTMKETEIKYLEDLITSIRSKDTTFE